MSRPYGDIDGIYDGSVSAIAFNIEGSEFWPAPYNDKWADEENLNIVPGSFNPLHAAHRFLYHAALDFGGYAMYEISISRDGKIAYTKEELQRVLYQFLYYAPVVVTTYPTFREKTSFFKEKWAGMVDYHIGIDTARRLLEQDPNASNMSACFTVYPRMINGKLESMEPVGSFFPYRHSVPEEITQLSSTEIRNAKD